MATATSLQSKPLDTPDEIRPFADRGRLEVVHLGDITIGRGTFEPGWRWSQHVKPLAGTDSCQTFHAGYVLSGRMRVAMEHGEEAELGAGEAFVIPPGHDAWTVGDEPCVLIDVGGLAGYAQPH